MSRVCDLNHHPERQAQTIRTQRVQMAGTSECLQSGGPAVVGFCTCGCAPIQRVSPISPVDR
jgi:hypothetical protein